MRFYPLSLTVLAAGFLAGCAVTAPQKAEVLSLKETTFTALPGWGADKHAEAIPPLQKSCALAVKKNPEDAFGAGGFAGKAGDWREVCEKLGVYLLPTDDESRAFFEQNFTPYEIHGAEGREGLFTGYYEPLLKGSLTKKPPYLTPLYARPSDLITVNLGDFKPELKGETVMGRVDGEKLIPYFTRSEIEKGALESKDITVVWVDDPVDAFFLHIQGSGQVVMEDGAVLRIGYAAQNGHPYLAIGKMLIERGELTKENVSMQSIRAWLESHPAEAPEVMNLNNSFVFFKKLEGEGPLGAQGVPLTPGRSLAIDRKKIPYGAPIWLDAEAPEGNARLQRLMVAQDTGGAINGAVRGDYFWGAGDEAAHKAGIMKSKGQAYILLPKSLSAPSSSPLAASALTPALSQRERGKYCCT